MFDIKKIINGDGKEAPADPHRRGPERIRQDGGEPSRVSKCRLTAGDLCRRCAVCPSSSGAARSCGRASMSGRVGADTQRQ